MTKGISPLIATVLLIALTLSIAGLLGSWLSTMTKTQTGGLEKSSENVINCTSAQIDIFQIKCGNTSINEPNTIRVSLSNVGNTPMYDFSTFVQIGNTQYINSTGGPNITSPMIPGEQITLVYGCDPINICPDGASISRVRVTSGNCPSQGTIDKTTSVTCV